MARLNALPPSEPRIILATGKLVGEGFDHAPLDTLVLAMPVSRKGTLQQYAGRLHREHAGKTGRTDYRHREHRTSRLAADVGQAPARLPQHWRPDCRRHAMKKASATAPISGERAEAKCPVSGSMNRPRMAAPSTALQPMNHHAHPARSRLRTACSDTLLALILGIKATRIDPKPAKDVLDLSGIQSRV
jgi:superfamily II DNA or RNA helicase